MVMNLPCLWFNIVVMWLVNKPLLTGIDALQMPELISGGQTNTVEDLKTNQIAISFKSLSRSAPKSKQLRMSSTLRQHVLT